MQPLKAVLGIGLIVLQYFRNGANHTFPGPVKDAN